MPAATSPKAYALKQLTPIGGKLLDTASEFKALDVADQESLVQYAEHEMNVLELPIKAS